MNARLVMELEAVERILARPSRATLVRVEPDGRVYEIVFDVRTMVCGRDQVVRAEHRQVPVLYDLAARHPVENPLAIAGHTDLFNPNVNRPSEAPMLPPLAFVCLGSFTPAMKIADWIIATYALLAWQRVAADRPLSASAAAWARREGRSGRVPTDTRPFFDDEPAAGGGAR